MKIFGTFALFSIIMSTIIAGPFAASNTHAYDILFSEDFEGAWPNTWVVGNEGGATGYVWGDNAYRAYAGSWSGFCADKGDNFAHTYPNDLHTYTEKRGVSLVAYTFASLIFFYWINTEANWDLFSVRVRDQSGAWHSIFSDSGDRSATGWISKVLDLSPFLGQSGLYIQFRFDSDSSVTSEGVYLDSISLLAVCDPPLAPGLLFPPNGATGVSATTFLDWDDVSGATSYDVQLCIDSGCSSVVRSATVSSSQWVVSPALTYGTQYWWRARASNSCGNGSWTGTWSFTTKPATSYVSYVSKDGFCSGHNPCYPNIQNGIAMASGPSIIEITQETYNENIVLNFDEEITLEGGWDTNFTANSSYTTINGSLTITSGTMIIENIILQ